MKKILITILAIILILPVISFNKVYGEENTGDFEVAYINDDGSFKTEAYFEDFDSAKNKMHELGGDRVVRHKDSLSPSKIIAMNSGVAYSYPGRISSKTLNIYQDMNNHSIYYKQTYISNHYELYYHDTCVYFVSNNQGLGMVKVSIEGFDGYCDLEAVDLVPSKFIEKGIALYLGGNNPYEEEEMFLVTPKKNYYEVVKNGNYSDLVYHVYRAYPSNGTEPVSSSYAIGPASEKMKTGVKYYSKDGVNFYTDEKLTSDCVTYYPYYQFLPLRSKTNISADTLNKYISQFSGSIMADKGQNFIDAQNKYGINALILFAMACHESGNGKSPIAVGKNNLFGWNAVDSSPGQSASAFESVEQCINEQAGVNLRGFVDVTDGRFFSSSLGNKGSGLNVKYASDPYWGANISAICYRIDKMHNNNDGNLSDYNAYNLSIIKNFDVEVKKEADDNSSTLYTTQYGPYYQKNFIVIDLGNDGKYTKIQSTTGIDAEGNLQTHRTPITVGELNPISTYDFDTSIAYIKSEHLEGINHVITDNEKPDETLESLEAFSMVDKLEIKDNKIYIEGVALIKGMNFTKLYNVEHYVVLKNADNYNDAYMFKCESVEYTGIDFNDEHIYKYVGFKGELPLSEVEKGSYVIDVRINNKDRSFDKRLISMDSKHKNINVNLNDLTYHLCNNRDYSYRLELNVESLPETINYELINKPSSKVSLFSFDSSSIQIDESANFKLNGQGMIYYCDYSKLESANYTIYFVEDKNNYLEIPCTTLKSDFDYQTILQSSNNLDNICFEADGKLSELKPGTYRMILKIQNGNYIDFIEMTNRANAKTPVVSIEGRTYTIKTSKVRNRLELEVNE